MGTRYDAPRMENIRKDHPHAYGDKKDDQYLIVSAKGSSPRVWGQDHRFRCYAVTYRIIPTRMGTSTKLYQT